MHTTAIEVCSSCALRKISKSLKDYSREPKIDLKENFKINFLHDEKTFLIQFFFYDLEICYALDLSRFRRYHAPPNFPSGICFVFSPNLQRNRVDLA